MLDIGGVVYDGNVLWMVFVGHGVFGIGGVVINWWSGGRIDAV